ncbi:MAG: ATP-binding protein [Bacteroidota bacterium]
MDFFQTKAGKILFAVFISLSLLVLVTGLLSINQFRNNKIKEAGKSLQTVALLKAGELEHWTGERESDCELFKRNVIFGNLVERYLTDPGDTDAWRRISGWLTVLAKREDYQWILLVDTRGQSLITIPRDLPEDPDLDFDYDRITEPVTRLGAVHFGSDSLPQLLHWYMISPVFPDSLATRPSSYLVARISHDQVIRPMLLTQPTIQEGLEMILIYDNPQQSVAVGINRATGNLAVFPMHRDQLTLIDTFRDTSATFQYRELGGRRLVMALEPVPGTRWMIVAFMDRKDAIIEIKVEALRTILIMFILICAIGILMMYLFRRQQSRMMSEQLQASRAIEENFRMYLNLFTNSPIPMFIFRLSDLRFLEVNEETVRHYGYSKEEFMNMTLLDIRPESEHERLKAYIPRITPKLAGAGVWIHRKKDGSLINVDITTTTMDYEREAAAFTIAFDVTERERWMKDMIKARDQAEESDHLKSSFLANMSHEIRTPLNAIVGFSSLLDEEEDPGIRHRFIRQINLGADQLLHIINDILDISKIEAGQITILPEEVILPELFLDLEKQYRMIRGNESTPGVELKLSMDYDHCPETVLLDSNRLIRVISNLLDNALKFTNEGSVTFGYHAGEPGYIRFFVKDTGIGIHPDMKELVFERFRQAEQYLTRKYGGTGLGLAISKSFVELMGGQIGVDSEPGAGSEFWFILPVTVPKRAIRDA